MIHKTSSQIFEIPNLKNFIEKLKENLDLDLMSLDLMSSYNIVGQRAQNFFTDF